MIWTPLENITCCEGPSKDDGSSGGWSVIFDTESGGFVSVLSDTDWQNIKVPLMFVVGENEKIYSAEKAIKRLNSVNPKIRTEIIPNAGHDLTIVQSERFNKLVVDFLSN